MPKPKSRKSAGGGKFGCLFRLFLFGLAVGAVVCVVYAIWAEKFDMKDVANIPERSGVYDMDGKFYSRLERENRVLTTIDKVSPWFTKALLAREDTRFYSHHGVDPIGILRAIVRNIVHLSVRQGASTITQQLARNSFLLGGHTLHRKLLEAFVAIRIERTYSKKEILDFYMNRILFGGSLYGVETASQAYFGKSASALTLPEAATLVGLIRGPNLFSPFKNPKACLVQRNTVLDRMEELKMITPAQHDTAQQSRLIVSKKRPPVKQENYAMGLVFQEFHTLISDDQILEGGLRIYTTIDPQLQKSAATTLDTQLRKIEGHPGYSHPRKGDPGDRTEEGNTNYLQGAVVVIDNRTGGIRAIVGGRDYTESTFDRAISSPRQVGSTFKPFVYAAAFRQGLSPQSGIDDSRIRPGEIHGAGNWSPDNSDGTYRGVLPAEEGLIQSRNTMTVRVGNYAGVSPVSKLAGLAGLADVPQLPSAYIGSFEATLRDLTAAYTIFPNDGIRRQSYIIERIDDSDGQTLYRAAHITTTALDPGTTGTVSSILEKVLQRGTAAAARSLGFNKPAGGKTGTTNDYKDAWFVGYTRSLTCGVWVGLDTPATIVPKGYGAALALPVWTGVMNAAPAPRYPAPEFPPPGESEARGTNETPGVPQRILRSFQQFFGH